MRSLKAARKIICTMRSNLPVSFHVSDRTDWHSPHRTGGRSDQIQARDPYRGRQWVFRSTSLPAFPRQIFHQRSSTRRTYASHLFPRASVPTRLFTCSLAIFPNFLLMSWPKSVVNGIMGTYTDPWRDILQRNWLPCCSEYEGLFSSEIKQRNATWSIWKDGWAITTLMHTRSFELRVVVRGVKVSTRCNAVWTLLSPRFEFIVHS